MQQVENKTDHLLRGELFNLETAGFMGFGSISSFPSFRRATMTLLP